MFRHDMIVKKKRTKKLYWLLGLREQVNSVLFLSYYVGEGLKKKSNHV